MATDLVACPVPGCLKRHRPGLMMCWGHWKKVPRALQRRVYAAYNFGHLTADYSSARDDAIAAAAA